MLYSIFQVPKPKIIIMGGQIWLVLLQKYVSKTSHNYKGEKVGRNYYFTPMILLFFKELITIGKNSDNRRGFCRCFIQIMTTYH